MTFRHLSRDTDGHRSVRYTRGIIMRDTVNLLIVRVDGGAGDDAMVKISRRDLLAVYA